LTAGLCRKNYICIWDSNISPRPRKNGSFELHYLLQSEKIFLHVDVKERTSFDSLARTKTRRVFPGGVWRV